MYTSWLCTKRKATACCCIRTRSETSGQMYIICTLYACIRHMYIHCPTILRCKPNLRPHCTLLYWQQRLSRNPNLGQESHSLPHDIPQHCPVIAHGPQANRCYVKSKALVQVHCLGKALRDHSQRRQGRPLLSSRRSGQ